MSAEQLDAELAEVYARTGETLDFLIAVTHRDDNPVPQFVEMANDLSASTSDRLAAVLAVAIQRLVEADHTKARLRRRIHRANRGRAALRGTTRTETRSEA